MANPSASDRFRRTLKDFTPPIALRAANRLRSTLAANKYRATNGGDGTGNPEYGADWYDESFAQRGDHYRLPYWKQNWYGALTLVAERIVQMDNPRVLDMGCGPAPLAQLLFDRGIRNYTGFDFSVPRLDFAKTLVPEFRFEVADVYTTDLFERVDYSVVVGTEFLEHLEGDLTVLDRVRPGARVICNVPDYGHASHVRFFRSESEVIDRYGSRFSEFRVDRVHNVSGSCEYVFDGIRLP